MAVRLLQYHSIICVCERCLRVDSCLQSITSLNLPAIVEFDTEP